MPSRGHFSCARWRARGAVRPRHSKAVTTLTVSGWARGDRALRVADPLAPGPGVEPAAGKPASSSASRLWQAVTPEPHIATSSPGGRLPASPASARAARGRQELRRRRPGCAMKGWLRGAGDMAGDRIEGLVLAREAIGGARIHEQGVRARAAPAAPPRC